MQTNGGNSGASTNPIGAIICLVLFLAGGVLLYKGNEEKTRCDERDARTQEFEHNSNVGGAALSRLAETQFTPTKMEREDRTKCYVLFGIGGGAIALAILCLVIVVSVGKNQT